MTNYRFHVAGDKRVKRMLLMAILLISSVWAAGEREGDVIVIAPEQLAEGYQFYIENRGAEACKVAVDVELTNMNSDMSFPYTTIVPAHSRNRAFRLWQADSSRTSGYKFDYKWRQARSESRSCVEEVFCIITEMRGDTLYFSLENEQLFPITVKFIPNGFRNLDLDAPMPLVKTYAGHRRTDMFVAWLVDEWGDWEHGFHYQWQYGIADAQHDDSYAYALPYARGKKFIMIQGPDGEFSHQGKNAYDWEMPVGTPVHAAREGVVMDVIDNYSAGGEAEYLKKEANSIEILHPDGTIGRYSHLAKDGALVKKGERVRRGQRIGLSGNTGYSTGPHLHFDVIRLTKDLEFDSLPVCFQVSSERRAHLQTGEQYQAFE
ncbi:M23 family metallopeptidase [candidate division KSB1 bacterium]|nr:M23 family metallopeptidase [candidate division KSB1 bacterium]